MKVAPKMKVLELNQNFLIWLGVYRASEKNLSRFFKINYILVLTLQVLGLVSSIWFIAKFIKIDLNSVLYAGFHTSAYSTSTYSLLVGFMVQQKIMSAFGQLQQIYNDREFYSIDIFIYIKRNI